MDEYRPREVMNLSVKIVSCWRRIDRPYFGLAFFVKSSDNGTTIAKGLCPLQLILLFREYTATLDGEK